MLKIHSKSLSQKHYFAPFFSFQALLAVGFVVGALIIPFAIAYVSGPYWIKRNVYQEQPKIILQQSVYALLEGWDSATAATLYPGAPLQIHYSSNPAVFQVLDALPRVSTIKTYNIDYNGDGLIDWFWLNMTVPLKPTESIYHVRLAFALQVALSNRILLYAPALGMVDIQSGLPGSGVSGDGILQLLQKDVMTDTIAYSNSVPVIDWSNFLKGDINSLSWSRIVSNYLDRNFQPSYQAQTFWNFPPVNNAPFTISLKIRIPTWDVEYRPGILEVLRSGWIIYFSVFCFTSPILWLCWDFLITHQVLKTIAYTQAKNGEKLTY